MWSTEHGHTDDTVQGVPSAMIHLLWKGALVHVDTSCPCGLSWLLQIPSLSFGLRPHLFMDVVLTRVAPCLLALAKSALGATRGRRGERGLLLFPSPLAQHKSLLLAHCSSPPGPTLLRGGSCHLPGQLCPLRTPLNTSSQALAPHLATPPCIFSHLLSSVMWGLPMLARRLT